MLQIEIFKNNIEKCNINEITKSGKYLIKYFFIYEVKNNDVYKEIEEYSSIISEINYEIIIKIPILYLLYCILLRHTGKFNELEKLIEKYNTLQRENIDNLVFFDSTILLLKAYIDINKHKYKKALEKLLLALKNTDLYSEEDLLLSINYNIARVHYYLFNITESLVYYKKSEYYIITKNSNSLGLYLRVKIDIISCIFMKNELNNCFNELNKLKIFINNNKLDNSKSIIYYYDFLVKIYFYRNKKEWLFECLDKLIFLFDKSFMLSTCMVYINLAKYLILLNEFEKAKIIIDKIETYFKLKKVPERIRMFLYLLNFILARKLNQKNEYNAWFKQLVSIADNEDYYIEAGVSIVYAYFFLECNNIKEAERIYMKTNEFFSQKDCELFKFKLELLKIAIDYKKGDTFKSRLNLKEKLFFSQKDSNIGIYLESSDIIISMIYEIYNESINKKTIIEIEYLKQIIDIFESNLKNKINFTEKEINILKLVDLGLTNKEIANKLFISINTLKTHIKTINTKLHTDNKEDALIKAKDYFGGII
ncbi:MAG: helix-turn-helix transcriptional regulator [Candidatus Sericytochromatia bacterium]